MATLIAAIAGLVVALTGIIAALGALARDREQLRTLERVTALLPALTEGKDRALFQVVQSQLVDSVFERHVRRESGKAWALVSVPMAIIGGGLGVAAVVQSVESPYFLTLEITSWAALAVAIFCIVMGNLRVRSSRARNAAQQVRDRWVRSHADARADEQR